MVKECIKLNIIHDFLSLAIQTLIKVKANLPFFNTKLIRERIPRSNKESPKRFMLVLMQGIASHKEKQKFQKQKLFTNHSKTKI